MTTNPLILLTSTILLTTSLYSCYTENDSEEIPDEQIVNTQKTYELADRELWSYFSSFENEAAERNIAIDLNDLGITAVVENISESGVAGTCQYGLHVHHVTIDKPFWDRASTLLREMVVYHELGHCVLGLGHTEDDNDGTCLSIMNSGTTDCTVRYNQTNRDYYLDELFSQHKA